MTAAADEDDLVELAYGDPERAIVRATVESKRAELEGDLTAASVAYRALGLARRATNELPAAREALERAVLLAGDEAEPLAAARATLAGVHVLAGRLDDAEAQCRAALSLGAVRSRGYVIAQLGLVLLRRGDSAAALEHFGEAIGYAALAHDRMTEANARSNRAILLSYAGRCSAGSDDLRRARHIYLEADQRLAAAGAAHNLGFVLGRAGDFPASLRAFDDAEVEFTELAMPRAELVLDRCEVLLAAGLAGEASALAERCASELAHGGMAASHAEALVMQARASSLLGDASASHRFATLAIAEFEEQGRALWGATAGLIELESTWASGSPAVESIARGRRLGEDLKSAGFAAESDQAMLLSAQIAHHLDEDTNAIECLDQLLRTRGPMSLRERAVRQHGAALRARWTGDVTRAERHLRNGLRTLDSLQATLGSSELRAGIGRFRVDLVSMGIERAIERDDTVAVLRWVERGRRFDRSQPIVADPEIDGILSQVRSAAQQRNAWASDDGVDLELLRRHRNLEAEAIRQLRTQEGGGARTGKTVTLRGVRSALNGRTLLEYFVFDGDVWLIRLNERTITLSRVGPLEEIRAEVDHLRSGLRRLRRPSLSAASAHAAKASIAQSGKVLEERLLTGRTTNPGGHVICPPAVLLDLPWMALPSLAGREVWITPSISRWLEHDDREPRAQRVGLIAGPRLRHAPREVNKIARLYQHAESVVGAEADTTTLKRLLAETTVLHIAAHGTFRSDNPTFSTVELHDGPMLLAELERGLTAPHTVVLAMCDSGRVGVQPGDEATGLATALLSLGARQVIMSLLPIDDERSVSVMREIHRAIAEDGNAARGLAVATASSSDLDDVDFATRSSFVCFGAL